MNNIVKRVERLVNFAGLNPETIQLILASPEKMNIVAEISENNHLDDGTFFRFVCNLK